MNPTGRARTETDIVDISVLVDTGLKGISAVLGVTERGNFGETKLVGSWAEYVRHFGGLVDYSDFPHLCKRTLERGGRIRVGRVGHYTDVTDKSTLVGVKASGTLATIKFEAKNEGAWGNELKLTLDKASDGSEDAFDLKIQLLNAPDYDTTVENINKVLTASDIQRLATENTFVSFDSSVSAGDTITSDTFPVSVQFTLGEFDASAIVPVDYIGDSNAGTGLHVFDNYNDFVKIAIPEMAIPEIDIALASYVDLRQDCRAILRSPKNLDGLTAIDYRNGTGEYSHSAIDTWRASMVFGEEEVTHPISGAKVTLPAISDVLGCYAQKDEKAYEWFSTAGSKRGRLKNVLGIKYNLGTPARNAEFDQVVNAGINPVIDDTDFGPVYWGSRTLSKGKSLTQHDNVADLLIFLGRGLSPLVRTELFDPNDTITWGNIYRNVNPFMQLVKDRRGIWDYIYEGDQFVDDISEAKINNALDIDKGMYVFYLWIKPKVGLNYIGIKVIVTNSGVNFEELVGQPNSVI